MRSPLETSVEALRSTRLIEEFCAWAVAPTQFVHKTSMPKVEVDGTLVLESPGQSTHCHPLEPLSAIMMARHRYGTEAANVVYVAPASSPFLGVHSITKQYADQVVLADVSFDFEVGQIIGIIGPNGAGKTTLLEAVAGILPIDHGDVRWHGRPLAPSGRRDAMFYLPDGVRPYQDQPVTRVLSFFADVYRRSADEVTDAIRSVGLTPVLHKRVHSLSKGYGRRLILALGLLTPQPLLLMDEPFDGFDLRQVREMVGVLRAEAAKGRTLVLAIHQLMDAERICDRFILLADGRVRGMGTLNDLRAQIGNPNGNLEDIFLALT
jgi:ABC-2 type transport system ATP-binding protein